ncbi:MAG: hypothetical protein ACI35O_09060 [Bacillaceae bacterium]
MMKLYLLKRDHIEGQSFYGVFESEELARQQFAELKEWFPNVREVDYVIKEITLNELTDIDPFDR